jgi:hypothetical protein
VGLRQAEKILDISVKVSNSYGRVNLAVFAAGDGGVLSAHELRDAYLALAAAAGVGLLAVVVGLRRGGGVGGGTGFTH